MIALAFKGGPCNGTKMSIATTTVPELLYMTEIDGTFYVVGTELVEPHVEVQAIYGLDRDHSDTYPERGAQQGSATYRPVSEAFADAVRAAQ